MLLFIAVVYILLWCFLYSKKYMAWEVPSGYVRPTLMGPSCGGGDTRNSLGNAAPIRNDPDVTEQVEHDAAVNCNIQREIGAAR